MTDANKTDATQTVDSYLELLNPTDAAKCRALAARAWASDASFLDPLFDVRGRDQLAGLGATIAAQYPGHRFRRVTGIDQHHSHLRFGWEFAAPDGKIVVTGTDFAELAADGRLQRVTGFFGPLPAA